jgi:hypothetical protein
LDAALSRSRRRTAAERSAHPHLSLLEFDARVLAPAEDVRTPLLERLRYLDPQRQPDEFYMGIGREVDGGLGTGLPARQQLCIADCPGGWPDRGTNFGGGTISTPASGLAPAPLPPGVLSHPHPPRHHRSPGHLFPVIPALTLSLAIILQSQGTGLAHSPI